MKIAEKITDLNENAATFCDIAEEIAKMNDAKDCKCKLGAVQRNANLVDLENLCEMRFSRYPPAVHRAENEPLKVWPGQPLTP